MSEREDEVEMVGTPGAPRLSGPPARSAPRSPAERTWLAWLGGIALAVAIAVAAWTAPRIADLRSEATHRLQALEQRLATLESMHERTQDELRDARSRTAVLESRALDAASLQTQIEKLYRNLAEDSSDVLLAEIESSVVLAGQQLALGSSVQAPLTALQEIESRLVRQDDPALQPLRRAISADIERLKAYPAADINSLAQRLDGLVRSSERFPLLGTLAVKNAETTRTPRQAKPESGEKAGDPAAPSRKAADAAVPSSAPSRAVDAASAGLGALRDELEQLFRVRRIETPESMLVAPDQAYFLRENLRLLLLNARLSLLSRNEALLRTDLERAIDWLRRYYDADDRAVAGAIAQLRQVATAKLELDPPTLTESLAAVRAARLARDAVR